MAEQPKVTTRLARPFCYLRHLIRKLIKVDDVLPSNVRFVPPTHNGNITHFIRRLTYLKNRKRLREEVYHVH